MHDLPRSAFLFLSTGRSGERDDGQWDHATLSQLKVSPSVCADIYPGGLYNTSELCSISLKERSSSMSKEYRCTIEEGVMMVRVG